MADSRTHRWHFTTRLVHEGEHVTINNVRATAMPVFATSTFMHESAEELNRAFDENGWVYGRYGNPTVEGFERAITAIEGGVDSVAFSSGMAALYIALLVASTPRGATQPEACKIVASDDLYGASRTLLNTFFAAQGWSVSFCDMSDPATVEEQLRAQPTIVFFEPISNPLLKLCDVARIVELAHEVGARVVVDNTLASPVLLRPLELGADLVVHSATKYLGGHGDVIGGVVAARTGLLAATLRTHAKLLGATLGPYEARLLSRGLRTLALRMREQSANAYKIARWLSDQPQVARVHYPGLPSHPQHELARQLFGEQFGGMVSFDLVRSDRASAHAFMDALELILPATTLGDIFSLVSYSAESSHRDLTAAERQARGISDGLLRLSIGIEDANDLIDDLEHALRAVDAG